MLETSQDLFYIVLAFCILWFTIFLCWMLYYFIRLLKQTNQVLTDIKEKMERVSNLASFLKSKIVETGVNGLMGFFSQQKEKKTKRKKKK